MSHPHAHPVTGASPTCIDCLGVITGRGRGALRCLGCFDRRLDQLARDGVRRLRARRKAERECTPVPEWAIKRKEWAAQK